MVEELGEQGVDIQAATAQELPELVPQMDIVSCATMAEASILKGEWLSPGCHLDLVGSFTPTMREADDEALRRSHIFVDTRAGALSETGELLIPIRQEVITQDHVLAELSELCGGKYAGRSARPWKIWRPPSSYTSAARTVKADKPSLVIPAISPLFGIIYAQIGRFSKRVESGATA